MWDYNSFNRQSLARVVSKGALATGRLVHLALSEWLQHPEESLVELYMHFAAMELEEVKRNYQATIGVPISDSELGGVYDAISTGHTVVTHYEEYYKKPLPEGFSLVAAEVQLSEPIPGTEHFLEGKLDAIVQHANGLQYVLEHKTFSVPPRETDLQMNDQFLAYAWMLMRRNGGGRIGGVMYDGVSKKASSKQGLEGLFHRTVIIRPPEELAEFERNLQCEADDMAEARIYPNRQWNGCWDCDYADLCAVQSRGEDLEYFKGQFFVQRQRTGAITNDNE